jgi:hypothetical protein
LDCSGTFHCGSLSQQSTSKAPRALHISLGSCLQNLYGTVRLTHCHCGDVAEFYLAGIEARTFDCSHCARTGLHLFFGIMNEASAVTRQTLKLRKVTRYFTSSVVVSWEAFIPEPTYLTQQSGAHQSRAASSFFSIQFSQAFHQAPSLSSSHDPSRVNSHVPVRQTCTRLLSSPLDRSLGLLFVFASYLPYDISYNYYLLLSFRRSSCLILVHRPSRPQSVAHICMSVVCVTVDVRAHRFVPQREVPTSGVVCRIPSGDSET